MKQVIKIVRDNPVARRNPMAASLCDNQFRKQVINSKKAYKRRDRNNVRIFHD